MNDEKDVKVVECNFKYRCPQKWEEMRETEQKDARFCGECKEMVYFAETDGRLRELRDAGKCVAVWEHKSGYDLPTVTAGVIMPPDFYEPPKPVKRHKKTECPRCRISYPPDAKFCGRCGGLVNKA